MAENRKTTPQASSTVNAWTKENETAHLPKGRNRVPSHMKPVGMPNLFCFPSDDSNTSLAAALRTLIVRAQSSRLHQEFFRVAVSGGSLPKTLAQALLAPPTGPHDAIMWDKWQIFFADERAVQLDHPDSNYLLLKTDLLDHIIPTLSKPPQVFPIDMEAIEDVQELADRYEQALIRTFASRDSVKRPCFDLILLGCGPDGHTCSLFPDHPLLRETSAWVAPIEDSPKPPAARITLTLPVVAHAASVLFVATGESKRDALRQIFDGDGCELPSALVNKHAGERCTWFVDSLAVKDVISFPKRTFPLRSHEDRL